MFFILRDEEVNRFLPWYPVKSMDETRKFYEERYASKDGLPYITATHDRNNLGSGGVMQNVGMRYQYSYEEQWQPKNILVTFRMYQLNLDGKESRVYQKYRDNSAVHFIEPDVSPVSENRKTKLGR